MLGVLPKYKQYLLVIKQMKLIGYWITSLRDQVYYPPQEFVLNSPPEWQALVANYLDNGEVFEVYRGSPWCRFSCGYSNSNMGYRDLSDGYFVWPDNLSHYVRDHNVQLPQDFIQHVQSGTPPIPKESWALDRDVTYWQDWCRTHVSDNFRNRLQAALNEANIRAKSIIDKVVLEMETVTGLADSCCIWKGCSNRALDGAVLCARCVIKGNEDHYVWEVYHPAPVLMMPLVRVG